jgi:hypothetical protein
MRQSRGYVVLAREPEEATTVTAGHDLHDESAFIIRNM